MSKKVIALLIAVLMMAACLSACGSAKTEPAPAEAPAPAAEEAAPSVEEEAPAAEPIVFRFATNQPNTHPAAKGYQRMADEVYEKSNGRLKIEVYYDGTLGDEKEYTDGLVNGTIEMAGTSPVEVSKRFSPLAIFDAPYIFDSAEHMLTVANGGAMDDYWEQLAKEQNIRVLGTFFFGYRNLTTSKIAATCPADMAGAKLRCIDSQISMATGRCLGANPVPMAFSELYLALQNNTVDAQENPVTSILAQKFYEVQHYLVLTRHVTAGNFFAIAEDKWQSLPDDLKQIVQDAVDVNCESITEEILGIESSGIEDLKGFGMEVIEPDIDAFRANAGPIQEEMMSLWGEDIYNLIMSTKA